MLQLCFGFEVFYFFLITTRGERRGLTNHSNTPREPCKSSYSTARAVSVPRVGARNLPPQVATGCPISLYSWSGWRPCCHLAVMVNLVLCLGAAQGWLSISVVQQERALSGFCNEVLPQQLSCPFSLFKNTIPLNKSRPVEKKLAPYHSLKLRLSLIFLSSVGFEVF